MDPERKRHIEALSGEPKIVQYKFQLGVRLGAALHEYIENPKHGDEGFERADQRNELADAIMEALLSGDPERGRHAIASLLFAIESQSTQAMRVASRARDAAMWHEPLI